MEVWCWDFFSPSYAFFLWLAGGRWAREGKGRKEVRKEGLKEGRKEWIELVQIDC